MGARAWLRAAPLVLLGRCARGLDDAEQFHVSVVGSTEVIVSWASPSNTTANLTIEEVDRHAPGLATPVPGSRRDIRPDTVSYQLKGSDGNGGSYGLPGVYTSPLLLHARVSVEPGSAYRYRVGGASSASWRRFRAPPKAGAERLRLAIVGDLGQTEFSRQTCASLAYAHKANPIHLGILLGDLSYADGNASRWDSFGRLFDSAGCADIPWLVIPGNHEVEPDALSGEPFLPYRRRWRTPEVQPEQVGSDFRVRDWATYDFESTYDYGGSFYSIKLGPLHMLMLNPYTSAQEGSKQHLWLRSELARVNRSLTPHLVAFTHAPWHHSGLEHRPEVEVATAKLRSMAEPLLEEARADMTFAGHVHAYERLRVPAGGGIRHYVVGNGGNYEKLYNSWMYPAPMSAFHSGEHYGWGELDLWTDASNFLMRSSSDSAVIDSHVAAARGLEDRCERQAPGSGSLRLGEPAADGRRDGRDGEGSAVAGRLFRNILIAVAAASLCALLSVVGWLAHWLPPQLKARARADAEDKAAFTDCDPHLVGRASSDEGLTPAATGARAADVL